MAVFFCHAQKTIEKTIDDPAITQIYIDAQQLTNLQITSVPTKQLKVWAALDGEYSERQLVSLQRKGNTLYIEPDFSTDFQLPNDKLSTHKIFAISLKLAIPDYLEVSVEGLFTQVKAFGDYKKLQISLLDGFCTLENVGKEVYVETTNAPIILKQQQGVVKTKSTYGEVTLETVPFGEALIHLNSLNGFIKVIRNVP